MWRSVHGSGIDSRELGSWVTAVPTIRSIRRSVQLSSNSICPARVYWPVAVTYSRDADSFLARRLAEYSISRRQFRGLIHWPGPQTSLTYSLNGTSHRRVSVIKSCITTSMLDLLSVWPNLRGHHVARQQQLSNDIFCPRPTSAANRRPPLLLLIVGTDRRTGGRTRPFYDAYHLLCGSCIEIRHSSDLLFIWIGSASSHYRTRAFALCSPTYTLSLRTPVAELTRTLVPLVSNM